MNARRHASRVRTSSSAVAVLAMIVFVFLCSKVDAQVPSPGNDAFQVAITFDDLPSHGTLPPGETRLQVLREISKALQEAQVPSTYGFLNGKALETEPASSAALDAWIEAGNKLGNHTWSHLNLNDNSVADYEGEIAQNEAPLQRWMKKEDWKWFRYPFLALGDTPAKRQEVRRYLGSQGYRIAAVTMGFGDYLWNEPYARCSAQADQASIAKLESSYLEAVEESITYYREISHTLFKKDIPYVLLMHVGAFDARMLPKVLEIYRSRGAQFKRLEEVEQDLFYAVDINLDLPAGADSLEGAMAERHLAIPPHKIQLPDFDNICRAGIRK